MNFQPLIDRYERVMHDQGQKKGIDKKVETYGQNAFKAAGTGGLALVSDVIELVYSLFDKESGTRALELMKPDNISEEEFVLYKICHKMSKLGSTPADIFGVLDTDGGGTISKGEFIKGIKKNLDLWIPEATIGKLFVNLNPGSSGEITKEIFLSKINMKTFLEWSKNPNWAISKASFLISLVEVYKHNQRKLSAHLNPNFAKYRKQGLEKNEFKELICIYESGLAEYEVDKLYNEALTIDASVEGASFKSTSSIMAKYGFGALKSFKIKELLQELSSRKTTIDVSLNAIDQGTPHRKARSTISGPPNLAEEEKAGKGKPPLAVPVTEVDTSASPTGLNRSKVAKKSFKK